MGCMSSKNVGVDKKVVNIQKGAAQSSFTQEQSTEISSKVNTSATVKPKIQVTERDKALLDLKHQRDLLNQLKKRTELNHDRETKVAAQLVEEGKRKRALVILRRRKLLERQIENADGKLEKVEQLVVTMETSEMQKSVLESIQAGTTALQSLQATMKLEDIEVLLQESREAIEYQEQVSAILGQELRPGELPGDEELEAELESYVEKENVEGKVEGAMVETELPSAPMDVEPGPIPESVVEREEETKVGDEVEDEIKNVKSKDGNMVAPIPS